MKFLRSSSEAEMIAEFLRQEYASSERYGTNITRCLTANGARPILLTDPDLTNSDDNAARRRILGCYRGYGESRTSFFTDFPTAGVEWQWVSLDREEIFTTWFIRYWAAQWGGCRNPRDVARMIHTGNGPARVRADGTLDRIRAVAESLRTGQSIPPLIIVSADQGSTRVVMEGNTRLTAYALAVNALPAAITVLLGTSADIARWDEY